LAAEARPRASQHGEWEEALGVPVVTHRQWLAPTSRAIERSARQRWRPNRVDDWIQRAMQALIPAGQVGAAAAR
jgi:hypothetical protein